MPDPTDILMAPAGGVGRQPRLACQSAPDGGIDTALTAFNLAEPASLVLLAAALAGIGLIRRKRSQSG